MTARALGAVLVAAALAAGGLGAVPGDGGSELLVLGDSYASGEGLATATGECGTEPTTSWGALLATARGTTATILACSGAEVRDVTAAGPQGRPAQRSAAAAEAPVALAALTVGGNDLGFVDIVADCLGFAAVDGPPAVPTEQGGWGALVAQGVRDGGCDVTQTELLTRVDRLVDPAAFSFADGSTGGLAAVYVALAEELLRDDGLLVVVGYPPLFAPPATWAERYGRRCHGLRAQDAAELVRVVDALDEVLAAEVAAANALLGADRVLHVSLLEEWAADGHHGLCGDGTPWVNGLTVVEGGVDVAALIGQLGAGGGLDLEAIGARPGGSFHPNTAGHAAIATVVAVALDEWT